LRHTFATTLVREAADLNAVKELGSWGDLKLLERYSHVSKDFRTRVINKLDGKFQDDDMDDFD
jgi:site-specific recombinase XerD